MMADNDSKLTKVDLQLWDVSGDKRFQNCWPTIFKGTQGLLLVYNGEQPTHGKELEDWYQAAMANSLVKETNSCVIQHYLPQAGDQDIASLRNDNISTLTNLAPSISKLTTIKSRLPNHGDSLREAFSKFVGRLLNNITEATEQEELIIINS